ncbi:MAG: plastocyanin/azurin family copper-binding protein, partial [Actinomycetota bacterium]
FTGGSWGSPPPDGSEVAVRGRAFEPSTLAVTAGDAVTWVWKERKLHNVSGEGIRSGDKRSGSFRRTFGEPGTYPYQCTLHPGMEGVVVVRSGASPPAPVQPTTGRGP